MKRIYIRKKNEASGHVFKSKWSVINDEVRMLPFTMVLKGYIPEKEWASSLEKIADKLGLYISETEIDGRTKIARNMRTFSWATIMEMKHNKSGFKPMGYTTVSNFATIEIEISNCGSMVRYRMVDYTVPANDWNAPVSDWTEIRFEKSGRAYFTAYNTKRYLDEVLRVI